MSDVRAQTADPLVDRDPRQLLRSTGDPLQIAYDKKLTDAE